MGNNWPVLPLDKIAKVIDSRHKTPQYSDIGYPMVRVVDVKGGELSLTDTKNVTSDVYADFSKGRDPEIGDLIISRVGSYGNVSYVSSKQKFCLGQNTALIIPKDNDRFLYYALISPQLRQQIDNMAVGAVQKTISLKSIRGLEIPQPPAQERAEIANFLSSLDDKITLNRQLNQTLEQMAQALFKSWFVDFDPVVDNALDAGFFEQDLAFPDELLRRAEARRAVREHGASLEKSKPLPEATRQLFPAAFEECVEPSVGLGGWVPQGWMAMPLTTVSNIVYGKNLPKSQINNEGYPVYGGNGIIGSYSKYLYKTPQVLISCRGAASGKVHWTKPFCFVTNNSLVIEEQEIDSLYIYYCLLQQDLTNLTSGSAQPQMTIANLNPVNILTLKKELITKFVQHAQDIQTNCEVRKVECETLSNLRDTLLPKLISGELRLDNISAVLANEGVA